MLIESKKSKKKWDKIKRGNGFKKSESKNNLHPGEVPFFNVHLYGSKVPGINFPYIVRSIVMMCDKY